MEATFSYNDVGRILCVSEGYLFKLGVTSNFVKVAQNGRVTFTRTSVLAYLAQASVLFHTTPEEWAAICLEPDVEIISKSGLNHFGVGVEFIPRFLASGLVPYIKTPGGGVRLPAQLVAQAAVEFTWLTHLKLRKLLKASKGAVQYWSTNRLFCSHPLKTEFRCPRPACMRDYIGRNATHPSLDPNKLWQAMTDGAHLATGEEAAHMLGDQQFEQLLAEGSLVGFRLPPQRSDSTRQELRFLLSDVIAAQHEQ